MTDGTTTDGGIKEAFKIDQAKVRGHVDRVVRESVEQTLNQLLDAEAESLCGAGRYERSDARKDTRAGHYQRKLHTKAGRVTLKVPRLRSLPFETQIIERYKRRESSVEEALIEMYLAGVSVRRVEDITEALWGTKVSPSTVSELNQKVYQQIEQWRNKPIEGEHPYVYLDGISLKRSWGGQVRNVSVLVAIGVATDGYREVLGIAEGAKEDKAGWQGFLRHLKSRGLCGVKQFTSDACMGLVESLGELSSGVVAALRGALVSQRVQRDAQGQGARGVCDAQGDPRPGGPASGPEESRRCCGEASSDEATQGGGAGPWLDRADAELHELSA